MRYLTIIAIGAACLAAAACTSSTKVKPKQAGDAQLTCAELDAQFAALDVIMADAKGDGSVNKANVVAAVSLIGIPALGGNLVGSQEAQMLVQQRRSHLLAFYGEKNCGK